MKLASLYLKAFGPFTDKVFDFGGPTKSLVLVYGPNEAGKSAMLRAVEALRFQIDRNSKDNFRHDYAEMCVGGTFLDGNGGEASVMRFKRLKDPLRLAQRDREGRLQATDTPAPSGLQDQLTGRLSQEEYRRMFGLDHDGLRAGGQRMAQGEEVGVSLFEASLGVRDIAVIGQELDAKARELFMPGARGTKGRINEALKRHKELHQKIRAATIRPREWQDRFSASERARAEVQRLDKDQRELNARLKLLATLRGAAPVVAELDDAEAALTELKHVPDLPEDAAERRSASAASLKSALDALQDANEAAEQAKARLDAYKADLDLIAQGAAITRLAAKGEEVDTLRRTVAQLQEQITAQEAECEHLAATIDHAAAVDSVLALAPGKSREAEIEQRVQEFSRAEQALHNHIQSATTAQEQGKSAEPSVPAEAVIRQLRHALSEVERERNTLARLRALPSELQDANSALAHLLHDLGVSGEQQLEDVRPVLDADIDEAGQRLQENLTEQQGLRGRVKQIEPALDAARELRDRMRNDQDVVTFDDVLQARADRDEGWRLVRAVFVESRTSPESKEPGAFTAGMPLPQAYEDAVSVADRCADAYARDTQAAAELKAKQEEIVRYENDLAALNEQVGQLENARTTLAEAWREQLTAHGLPVRTPLALREWQSLLNQARESRAALDSLRCEQQSALTIETRLVSDLRSALEPFDPEAIGPEVPLASLETMAREQTSRIQQLQQASDARAAQEELLARQAQQRAIRQAELERALAEATARLGFLAQELRVPGGSSAVAIRARLLEFAGLRQARSQSQQSKEKLAESRAGIAQISAEAKRLADLLGEKLPEGSEHLRPFFDVLEQRLERERTVWNEQQTAQRELQIAENTAGAQERLIRHHSSELRRLCELAGVADADFLPDVEARAACRRAATATRERCLHQLRAASDLTLGELREQLATQHGSALQMLEEQCASHLEALAPKLEVARAEAERTLHELEAIDASELAAEAQEELCQTNAVIEASLRPWMRLRLAHGLLMEAQRRFQERAQGPMLERASGYFQRMTDGAFARLKSDAADDRQVLVAERAGGGTIGTDAMSEGTRDQLYLALRLAAVSLRRDAGVGLPMVLDDVLMTSSDGRAGCVLQALGEFSRNSQVIVFTHHQHLLEVARRQVPSDVLHVLDIQPS